MNLIKDLRQFFCKHEKKAFVLKYQAKENHYRKVFKYRCLKCEKIIWSESVLRFEELDIIEKCWSREIAKEAKKLSQIGEKNGSRRGSGKIMVR